eukprot:12430297-Karenia_brevis.AAC.1
MSIKSLATPDYCAHLLLMYMSNQLKEILKVATSPRFCHSGDSGHIFIDRDYTETQIHGPIRCARDVDQLVVDRRHLNSDLEQRA